MSDLEQFREIIDECDREIVKAIEKRFNTVKEVLKYKQEHNMEIYQPNREKEVLVRVESYLENKEFSDELEIIYSHIMELSKQIQEKPTKYE